MEKTWRWFGLNDVITLPMLRQIGVEGVVTSLYNQPNGAVWSSEAVSEVKRYIEQAGLRWSVVESLPVAEGIKYASEDREQLIENYMVSLKNLGEAGVKTVCYNFMPVIDWVRTDLNYSLGDGTYTLFFDKIRFAYFDCFILEREGAQNDYSQAEMQRVYQLADTITQKEKDELIYNIIVKTQGFVSGNFDESVQDPVGAFKTLLARYSVIDKHALRKNMQYFLERVIPVAEQYDVNLCVHPDDPPFSIFGLPRIVTDEDDIEWILGAVSSRRNGLTFCAGSLGASPKNNIPALARKFASRTHFLHLRSTEVMGDGSFIETSHLEGRGELLKVIRVFEQMRPGLPMRIDHGKLMLGDIGKAYNPGYSFLGRMYALAQVSGLLAAVKDEIKNNIK